MTKSRSGGTRSQLPDAGVPRHIRPFFTTHATILARALLGCSLVRLLDDGTRLSGVIVETEAYLGAPDRASHARGGRRTARNEAMYAQPGTAYIYFTYGMHWCFNVVCAEVDVPHAVLVRALHPTEGLDVMRVHRQRGPKAPERIGDKDLCRGPARLCQALALDGSLNALDVVNDRRLWIEGPGLGAAPAMRIARSARIGVDAAGPPWAGRLLRYFDAQSPYVSGPRGGPRTRMGKSSVSRR